MDFDLLRERITIRLFKCNTMTHKEAEDYAALAVDEFKIAMKVSAASILDKVPNQHMNGFSASGVIREAREHSETFAHLFSDDGRPL